MLQDVKDLTASGVVKGLNTQYNLLALQKDQSPNMMDVKVNYDGSLEKRLGSNIQNPIQTITGGSSATPGFIPTTSGILTSFVSYWNLNEPSGDRRDSVGQGTFQQYGEVGYASGINKQSALFQASCSQYLSAASSQAFTGNPIFSYSAWFYLNSTSGTTKQTILAKRGTVGGEPSGIVADGSDSLVCNCNNTIVPTQFLDSSITTPKTITANGNATQLPIKFNKSAGFFNGTTDYVAIPNSSDFSVGTGDFQIEFFYFMSPAAVASNNYSFFDFGDGWASSGLYLRQVSGALVLYIAAVGKNFGDLSPTANAWQHFCVRRRSGQLSAWKDGIQLGTNIADSSNVSMGAIANSIGRGPSGDPSRFFNGWIKEFRFKNSSDATITVPTSEYVSDTSTKLLMHFDTPATSPLGPAIALDGTGDYLTVPDSNDWDFGTGDFKTEFYVRWGTVGTANLVSRGEIFKFYYYATALYIDSGVGTLISRSWTPSANVWYKLKAQRVSGQLSIWVNDIKQGADVADSTNLDDNTGVFIGARANGTNLLNGFMREVSIEKAGVKVLNVHGNENNGTAGTSILDTTGKTVTCVADAKIKYTEDYRSCVFTDEIGKVPYSQGSAKVDFFAIGSGVGYFDGTGDTLTVPKDADFAFGTGAYTMESYLRFSGTVTNNACFWGVETNAAGVIVGYSTNTLYVYHTGAAKTFAWTPLANTWYHLTLVRDGSSNLMAFANGTQIGSTIASVNGNVTSNTNGFAAGQMASEAGFVDFLGLLDNIRISKGVARYTATFNPSPGPTVGVGGFEYSLNIGTDNLVTFDVSSSGTAVDGTVKASSFGTIGTGTWYNAVCWYDSANAKIGIVMNGAASILASYTGGMVIGSSPLTLGVENTAHYLDGRIDEVGFWTKKLGSDALVTLYNNGSGNTYQSPFDNSPWASFDFGASSIRWLTCAAGTGVYASSNLGVTWVNIATDRSATYQYLDRSKNVEIITSEAYDRPLYWAGSVGTFASVIGSSTPLCKYSINFQGFLILLNSNTRKRSFNYIDENFQLTSTGWLNFDLPSSADDEITSAFILRRYLYVSTRYKIYRVSYVGGNPDWQFVEVKSWGFIPRTVKKVVIMNNQQGSNMAYSIGEVVVGLTWDRKLRIFDGSGDQILSNNIEKDNGMCEFALDKISYFGSGPIISFAELDPIPNVYRLCVAIGQDSQQTTHFMNYDGRSQALYPYANMHFNCMCVAESANRQFLMAFDRNGYCHMMDSGNLDGNTTPINDFYESPLLFDKTPSQSSKGHKTDLFFSSTTSGNMYYEDRNDFSNSWKLRKKFVINGTDGKIIHYQDIDVPEMYNTYQFRISSSSGQSQPYKLQRYDHFTKGLGIGKNY